MTHNSSRSHFTLEPDHDEFDPLEDSETNEEEWPDEYPAIVSATHDAVTHDTGSVIDGTSTVDERSTDERIEDLLTAMAPRRRVLLGVLSFCLEQRPVSSVNTYIDELQENNFSVYSAANLCSLLEKAGAIERISADGQIIKDVEMKPEIVVLDDAEYLETHESRETFWLTTEQGHAALEADKPLDRLYDLLEQDTTYGVIYERILTLCSAEGGATTPSINESVDHDPLVQKPRFYASHFISRLEKCDALSWKDTWHITKIGEAGLEMLANSGNGQKSTEPTADEEQ